jgi:hypothetical protein
MAVANLLDPFYLGKDLPTDGMMIISDFIHQYYPHTANIIWEQLLQYKTQTGIFNIKLAWNTVGKINPITWWKDNFDTLASQLCELAIRILTIPSSSAASERNWSNFSYIQDKKRNRLTDERLLKLVYIYSNYKLTLPRLESVDITESIERAKKSINEIENSNIQDLIEDDNEILSEESNIEDSDSDESDIEIFIDNENSDSESESESEIEIEESEESEK